VMELLVSGTGNHFILWDGDHSLWIDRQTGTLEAKTGRFSIINSL